MTTRRLAVGQRRAMTLDDVGDAAGVPLLYLHGTPDSRVARPADDGVAARAGVRLLALDRPGYGGSDPLPADTAEWTEPLVRDVVAVLDTLQVERVALLAWSGGTLAALALAGALPERVSALAIVAGLVPRQAYDDPAVREAGAERLNTLELADVLPPGQLGEAVAPLSAPYPCDRALALDHQAEHRDPAGAHELAAVRGGADRMADALVEAVRHGLAGVAADVEAQARPLDVDLATVRCRTRLWYGSADTVTPPAFGEWYARELPDATLDIVPGAAHYLLLTRWVDIIGTLVAGIADAWHSRRRPPQRTTPARHPVWRQAATGSPLYLESMPRLRQVPRDEAAAPIVTAMYDFMFGAGRDPVADPGTATGTPGDWWTTFALVPDVLEHCVAGFALYRSRRRQLPAELRELGQIRAGWARGSQFVFSQHCKSCRALDMAEEKIAAIPAWTLADCWSPVERAVLAYTDALVLDGGRVPDSLFAALRAHLGDEQILELTYITCLYEMHATMSRALRTEWDDRDDPVVEVPGPHESLAPEVGVEPGRTAGDSAEKS